MHVTVGVYMNGVYKVNIVRDEDLEDHIQYNKDDCAQNTYMDHLLYFHNDLLVYKFLTYLVN